MHILSLTFPITFITWDLPGAGLLLSIIANPTSSFLPKALALSTPPTSGATQIKFLLFIFFLICLEKIGVAKRLSTGMSKKPCICPECKSTVTICSAFVIKFETNFAHTRSSEQLFDPV